MTVWDLLQFLLWWLWLAVGVGLLFGACVRWRDREDP